MVNCNNSRFILIRVDEREKILKDFQRPDDYHVKKYKIVIITKRQKRTRTPHWFRSRVDRRARLKKSKVKRSHRNHLSYLEVHQMTVNGTKVPSELLQNLKRPSPFSEICKERSTHLKGQELSMWECSS